MLVRVFHQPDHTAGICFPENIFAMCFNRSFTYKKRFRDLFIVEFFFNQPDDLQLSRGEPGFIRFFFYRFRMYQLLHHIITEINTTPRNFLQRRN